jgi:activator of 2-hydroxyglutaryl-CoA dehydratase
VGLEEEITFTGGVAKNVAMIETLSRALGVQLNVSEESHYMGALGAALFALDDARAGRPALLPAFAAPRVAAA